MLIAPSDPSRIQARFVPYQGDFAEVRLPALPPIHGSVDPADQRYCYWLASATYAGSGAVVQIGTMLGQSSACIAAGLRDGGRGGHLTAFDRFEWRWHRPKAVRKIIGGSSDFQAAFDAHLRAIDPATTSIKRELSELSWDGGPVELLFLSAPKERRDLANTLAVFAPHLDPERSLVVCEEFAAPFAYAQPLVFGALADELERIHVGTSAVGYRLKKPLPHRSSLMLRTDFATWRTDHVREAWDAALAGIERRDTLRRLMPGLPALLHERGETELACRLLRGMEFTDSMRREWRLRAARPAIYQRYAPLFRVIDVAPPIATRLKWRARRLSRLFRLNPLPASG